MSIYALKKNMQRIRKVKRIKMLLNMVAIGSYMMYLKGDDPHQIVMIVCGCI